MKTRQSPLFGRQKELAQLLELKKKKTASLIVLWGRRRVGKSRLVDEFGGTFKKYYTFQGLGPRRGQTNKHQLDYFSEKLSEYFDLPQIKLNSWTEAFRMLALQIQKGEICILLDEISWMGQKDKDFPGKLKDAWDGQFSKNPHLNMILCGSVSSWIQENILEKTDFLGRVSLGMQIEQLPLKYANQFWSENKAFKIGEIEKLKAVMIAGGVPKYLEELASNIPIDQQIQSKCFNKNGFFFQEYEKIFSDIFGRKTETERKIVQALLTNRLTASEIAKKCNKPLNGKLTKAIHYLVVSGFLQQECIFKITGEVSDKVYYRIKDNYIRFYLKVIAPKQRLILTDIAVVSNIEDVPNWISFKAYQFENLIYTSLQDIINLLGIDPKNMISVGPYIQKKNTRNKHGCQIDLLIHTRKNQYFVCEIKSGQISPTIIKEIDEKVAVISWPIGSSIRSVLICNQISNEQSKLLTEDLFKIITLGDLLKVV